MPFDWADLATRCVNPAGLQRLQPLFASRYVKNARYASIQMDQSPASGFFTRYEIKSTAKPTCSELLHLWILVQSAPRQRLD